MWGGGGRSRWNLRISSCNGCCSSRSTTSVGVVFVLVIAADVALDAAFVFVVGRVYVLVSL